MTKWIVLGLVVVLVLVALLAEGPETDSPVSADDCASFAQVHSAERWARELGQSEAWVEANYRVRLWSKPSVEGSKAAAVGELLPGSRARIVDRRGDDYLVKSPLDGSTGWLGAIQVEREVMWNPAANEPCGEPAPGRDGEIVTIDCPDGTVYIGNQPEKACS